MLSMWYMSTIFFFGFVSLYTIKPTTVRNNNTAGTISKVKLCPVPITWLGGALLYMHGWLESVERIS